MTAKEEVLRNKSIIKEIAKKHGAYDLRIFGSVSRGEETSSSDIDFLVKTEKITSPWFPGGLIADLQNILGRKVDIVTENGLNKLLREHVLRDAIQI
jgi:uncharacterized protein